jgi:predicted Zn-dependent protease
MMERDARLNVIRKVIQKSPADQTEAILMVESSSLTRFTRSSIHQHVAEKNQTLILRVVMGKRIAVVTTNILEPGAIKETLQKAVSFARLQHPNEEFVSLPGPKPIPEVRTFSENIERFTPNRKVKIIKEALSLVEEKGLHASGVLSHGVVELAVANSLGVEAYQKYSDLFFHLIAENDKNSGYAGCVFRDPDQFDARSIAQEAIQKVIGKDPVAIEPGEYEVILEPYAVRELLVFLASLGFHALAVQEGRSFFCGHFGKKLVGEEVTVYDDGLDSNGLQVPFDFEGLPKQKVIFFENGIGKGITFDSFTAGKDGKESTGHALIPPNTDGPIPINLIMKEGNSSLEKMIHSVRKGIYVTRFHYTNVVDPMKTVITGMTRDGTFLIEDGEIKNPVKNLRFTESILKALSRVKAISKDRKICSEGAGYSRRFVTGTLSPAIQVDGFRFSGVSAL